MDFHKDHENEKLWEKKKRSCLFFFLDFWKNSSRLIFQEQTAWMDLQKLFDFNEPFDVNLLDQICFIAFTNPASPDVCIILY